MKPTPDSPLLKLGMDKVPPIVTSAVLLDAKAFVGSGKPMDAGELVTARHIEGMLKAQGLAKRGILPGDVVYVHTGWGDHWRDPDTEKLYYSKAPGLSYDAARWLGDKRVVAIGLDTPFIDPVPEGMLAGQGAGRPPARPPGCRSRCTTTCSRRWASTTSRTPSSTALARDKVWLSCTMVLPLREKGAAGSAVRPVAIGVPATTAEEVGIL